jgi:hypothetical protein
LAKIAIDEGAQVEMGSALLIEQQCYAQVAFFNLFSIKINFWIFRRSAPRTARRRWKRSPKSVHPSSGANDLALGRQSAIETKNLSSQLESYELIFY